MGWGRGGRSEMEWVVWYGRGQGQVRDGMGGMVLYGGGTGAASFPVIRLSSAQSIQTIYVSIH